MVVRIAERQIGAVPNRRAELADEAPEGLCYESKVLIPLMRSGIDRSMTSERFRILLICNSLVASPGRYANRGNAQPR